MEYLVGLGVALAVAGLATGVGFGRDRSFATTVLLITASYYVLFAVMGGSPKAQAIEGVVAGGFLLVGVLAYKASPWLAPAGMVAHGVFDVFHHSLIDNPGVPIWWPGFCLAFDVVFGAWLVMLLMRRNSSANPKAL